MKRIASVLLFLLTTPLLAEEMSDATLRSETNLLWMCIAAFLVFFMQAGFAFVEAGFTRAKNAVNILMKNVADFSVGGLAFFLFGFGIMFGPHILEGLGFGSPVPVSFFESTDGKP
ncbi:MAG: ammonium transporter, partial [Leptospiraceae bacterium]|nr:ammonium transporter [Leptospiraceae bacterium]